MEQRIHRLQIHKKQIRVLRNPQNLVRLHIGRRVHAGVQSLRLTASEAFTQKLVLQQGLST